MSDYQRPHNSVLVPCDKLKEMQDYIKHLESGLESSLGMSKALVAEVEMLKGLLEELGWHEVNKDGYVKKASEK